MNEDFLHYVWKFQKFSTLELATHLGESLQVLKVGTHNFNAGPDFLNSQIVIAGQTWAGTVEIHLRSSHWYAHRHETDVQYDNVILHVVWEHDMDIRRSDETIIPTLELKDKIELQILNNYRNLLCSTPRWINCEAQLGGVASVTIKNWLDRLFLERLEQKSELILGQLKASQNNWQAVLFQLLCKNFGLKVNGASFLSIAQSLDYKVVQKCRRDPMRIEALLLGQAHLLEGQGTDPYYLQLCEHYDYTRLKFTFSNEAVILPKFFRLRPPNFPTVRLAQLAGLLHKRPHLFSQVIAAGTLPEFYDLFAAGASSFWDTHYNFEVSSAKRTKQLSRKFIDLLLINTVIPLKHCYAAYCGKDISEEIIALASNIKGEENTIVKKFQSLRNFENTAWESQALLQLKNKYCDRNQCLRCAVGNSLLRG